VTPEGTLNYIRMDWQTASYNETTDWCHSLGGSLPVLHTQDDLDLFTERVIRKTSSNMVGNYSCSFQGMSMERQDIHREFAFLDHRLLIHVLWRVLCSLLMDWHGLEEDTRYWFGDTYWVSLFTVLLIILNLSQQCLLHCSSAELNWAILL